jgi:hypothetical protein
MRLASASRAEVRKVIDLSTCVKHRGCERMFSTLGITLKETGRDETGF